MITTVMAKIRKQFGLPPNATTAQISEAIDAAADAASTEAPQGAAAGAEQEQEAGEANTPAGTEAEASTAAEAEVPALSREDVMAIVAEQTAELVQANADLNAANAELSARLEAVEASEPEGETGGKKESATPGATEPWRNSPITQEAQRIVARREAFEKTVPNK